MIPPGGIDPQRTGRRPPGRRPGHDVGADPVDLPPMDPRDDLESLAGGVGCAACGELVPTERIRILARRDDLVFVEIACPGCRSDSLGIVIGAEDEPAASSAADGVGAFSYGEFGPGDVERFREALPIDDADIDAVRRALTRGGVAALVGRSDPPASGPDR
jgi:hypothetical protein